MAHATQGTGRWRGGIARLVRLSPALLAAAVIGIMSYGANPASAAGEIQVCFAVDASGSKGEDVFNNIEIPGLHDALEALLPQPEPVEVTVVVFSASPSIDIAFPPRLINNVAARDALLADLNSVLPGGTNDVAVTGGTNIGAAIDECVVQLQSSAAKFADPSVLREISLITDGLPTVGTPNPEAAATAARDLAVAAGIDFVDVLLVEGQQGTGEAFMLTLAWPHDPATDLANHVEPNAPPPVNPGDPKPFPSGQFGFVYHILNFADFAQAILVKVGILLNPPVGGIAELPAVASQPLEASDSSGPSAGMLAGAIAGAVVVGVVSLGGAAWYVRRRRVG